MNYLTEIMLFNQWLEDNEGLSHYAVLLWYGLMYIANRSGWKDEIEVSARRLSMHTHIPENSIFRVRKELEKAGLIKVSSRGGRASAIYRLISFEQRFVLHGERQTDRQPDFVLQGDGQNERQTDRQSAVVYQGDRQIESIYKHKQDIDTSEKENTEKKKKNGRSKSASVEGWVSSLEAPWKELMCLWLDYKKDRKEGYSSEMGAKACLTKLKNISGGNPDTAKAIIEQSMANNWAGLFPLSGNMSARGHPATGQRIGQIMQPKDEAHRQAILEKFRQQMQSGRAASQDNNDNTLK